MYLEDESWFDSGTFDSLLKASNFVKNYISKNINLIKVLKNLIDHWLWKWIW